MTATIEVLKPGAQTTIQDGGRPGHLGKGISAAGAQDSYALRLANALVGNDPAPPPLSLGGPGHAGLEVLLQGPSLRFGDDAVVAITGAEMGAKLDGAAVPTGEALLVPAGARLDVGVAKRGARAYVAVSGGIDVAPYLGSRSTHLLGALGGHQGRALVKGDVLPLGAPPPGARDRVGLRVPDDALPALGAPYTLRVVRGPQEHLFTDESLEAFYGADWTLSPAANRMGFRLTGPQLHFRPRPAYLDRDAGSNVSNIVDDIIPLGGIQAPDGAALIVMGVEHPTAGGYAKIATVISADLGVIGQARPGDVVRFAGVEAEDALAAAREQDEAVARLATAAEVLA